MSVLLFCVICSVFVLGSVLATIFYASNKKRRTMYIGFVCGLLVVFTTFIKFSLVVALGGGIVLIVALVSLYEILETIAKNKTVNKKYKGG